MGGETQGQEAFLTSDSQKQQYGEGKHGVLSQTETFLLPLAGAFSKVTELCISPVGGDGRQTP